MTDKALVPYTEIQKMAADVVKGGLFPGIKTPEQAIALFMIAQSEGLHPMTALMRYNIIQNRPAMKAEAMLASFMERGGTVEWAEYTDEAVTGIFTSHGVPKGVSVRWTIQDAKRAGITGNPTWSKYPKQMLKARVASDGVRMSDPAVNQGRYTPEEVSEFEPSPKPIPAEIVAPEARQEFPQPSEQDLTAALEGSLEVLAGDPPSKPLFGPAVPGHCTLKGCGGEIEIFTSTSKEHTGREYWMCAKAHAMREQALNDGSTVKVANVLVSQHFRQWTQPPSAVDRTHGKWEAE